MVVMMFFTTIIVFAALTHGAPVSDSKAVDNTKGSMLERVKRIEETLAKLSHGGFTGTPSLQDIQWQSLHMAAAAGCRTVRPQKSGTGPWGNAVYALGGSKTCEQICRDSKKHTICDGSLSIIGFAGQVHSNDIPVGYFYNDRCDMRAGGGHEPDDNVDIMRTRSYYGYCCCRHA